jgi:hypothetical protein
MTPHIGAAHGRTDRSRVLSAFADVLDLVGEAVAAATIVAGTALGAALPPSRAVRRFTATPRRAPTRDHTPVAGPSPALR